MSKKFILDFSITKSWFALLLILISLACPGCNGGDDSSSGSRTIGCVTPGSSSPGDACTRYEEKHHVWGFPACVDEILVDCKFIPTTPAELDPCSYSPVRRVEELGPCSSFSSDSCYRCPDKRTCCIWHYTPESWRCVGLEFPVCINGEEFDCQPIDDDRCCQQGYRYVKTGTCEDTLEGDQDSDDTDEVESDTDSLDEAELESDEVESDLTL